jgi:hypothetical protein
MRISLLTVALLTCCTALAANANAESAPGTLLSQDRFPAGEDPIAQVAVDGTRVFVAGKGPNTPGAGTGWLVRAYGPKTGAVLWHDVVTGFSGIENKANTVVAKGDLVFTGGFTSATVSTDSALIRTYDARTGALRWLSAASLPQ